MIILVWSCGHGDLLDFVFVISLYDGGSRSKAVFGVSGFFFIQVGSWNVSYVFLSKFC